MLTSSFSGNYLNEADIVPFLERVKNEPDHPIIDYSVCSGNLKRFIDKLSGDSEKHEIYF